MGIHSGRADIFYPPITRIADSISDISKELGYLLPDVKDCECNIRNFLPVIIWAYCMNRKSPRNKALFEDVAYRDRVSNNGSGAEKELNIRKINTHRGLFQLKQWESVYTGLEIQNVLLDTPKRILPIYYQALLFFYLLQMTCDMCNVTMSFLFFAKSTGLVELFGHQEETVNLINTILESKEPVADDFARDEILSFVDNVMNGAIVNNPADVSSPESQMIEIIEFFLWILRVHGYLDEGNSQDQEDIKTEDQVSGADKEDTGNIPEWEQLLDEVYIFLGKNAEAIANDDVSLLPQMQELAQRVKSELNIIEPTESFRIFALNLQETLLDRKIASGTDSQQDDAKAEKFHLESILGTEKNKIAWNKLDPERTLRDMFAHLRSLPEGTLPGYEIDDEY